MKNQTIKFDFHIHTTRSDGKHSPEETVKYAKEVGLDMIAITDHNTSNHGLNPDEIYKKYGIYLINGFELSLFQGHILILGIDPIKAELQLREWGLRKNSKKVRMRTKKIKEILKWAVDNGGLIIAAHPCIPSGFMSLKSKLLIELFEEGLIHGAEIHNDDIDRRIPTKIYNIWHRRVYNVLKKYNIPAYSNSDTHQIERLGGTYNIIKIDNPKKIIERLKTGRINLEYKKM
jgi:predicted metal-dependent phosphoesterase TrpH